MSCGVRAFAGLGGGEAGAAVFFGRGFGRGAVRLTRGAAGGRVARGAVVWTAAELVAEDSLPFGRGAGDGVGSDDLDVGVVAATGGSGDGVAAVPVDGCSSTDVEVGVFVFAVVFVVRSE